jgi:hypothetical protein
MNPDVYKTLELPVNPEPRYCGRTLAGINAINQEFWRKRAENRDRQLRDEHLANEAYYDLKEQMRLQAHIRLQKSYEELLDGAEERRERALQWVRQEHGRQGGKARKPDTLQAVIQKIVERKPTIDCPTLLKLLQDKQGIGVIEDVDGEDISFTDSNGRSKSTKITSLKDRLLRAKKKIKSQKAVSAIQS